MVSLLSCVEVEARNDGPIDQPEASRMLLKILSVKEFRLLLLPIQASLSLSFFSAPSANANTAEGLRIRTASIATLKKGRQEKRRSKR